MKKKTGLLLAVFMVFMVAAVYLSVAHIEKVQAVQISETKSQVWDFYSDGSVRTSFCIPTNWLSNIGYCQIPELGNNIVKVGSLMSPSGTVITYYSNVPKEYVHQVYKASLDESYYCDNNYGNIWSVQTDLINGNVGRIGVYTKTGGEFLPGIDNGDGTVCCLYGDIYNFTSAEDIATVRNIVGSLHKY